ncbi:Nvj2p [Sporobolomyces salmoneus]|uniref:Nvj2p n=1 Tax=Sporobolomyces salmoneus TaxID=183962 RepID=UPI003170B503
MVALSTLVLIYVAGGLTFVPLCLVAFLAFLFYTSPVVLHPPPAPSPSSEPPKPSPAKDKDTNLDDQELVTVYRAGWITARRTFEPSLNGNNEATYVGMLASGYRSFMDNRSKDPRRSKPKDRFFAVLKQNILFLYESEQQHECWAAIEVSSHDVVVYPEGYVDGEFWVKRTAIELKPKVRAAEPEEEKELDDAGEVEEIGKVEGQAEGTNYDAETGKPLPWFIFAKVNSDKEDWYHSLVIASRIGTSTWAAETARDRALFSSDDMANLVDSIDSLPDSIPMRWFNAILGRIFLAVCRTSSLESYITSRIVRKLKRVKIPSILSEIQVREVDVGSSTPLFSKPMLKELTTDGEASMEVHVSYVGAVRITIETVATVSISSRFKPYSVRLVLAVVLQELEGTLLLKIKKPPSNRIWFGFTAMPKIKLAVEPLVSTRQIKWSLITSPIESRIREVIAESIVVPHMDDLSFFSTLPFPSTARGGIFGAALRKERPDLNVPASSSDTMTKADQDLVSLAEGGEEEADLEESESKKEKVKMVEGVLMSEGKETADRARQRIRRPSSSSSMLDEDRDVLKAQLESRSPSKKPSSIKSTNSAASTSVSSLAGLASAKIASWREKKDELGMGEQREGVEKKRTSSWFAKSNQSSPALPPGNSSTSSLPLPAPSRAESGSSESASSFILPLNESEPASSTATKPPSVSSTSNHQEEISAAKLREILTKRAESREQEKKEKELALQEEESTLNKVLPPPETPERKLSNLSRTAPSDQSKPLPLISFDPSSPSSEHPVLPISSSPASSSVTELSTTSVPVPPTLPARPAWIKPEHSEAPSPVSSSPSSLPPPPPPIRRSPSHNASASVDSPSSSSSSSTTTTTTSILSSWRAKAADKEALAQSVAQAKESMKKWGAGWNARRTAGRPADAEGAGLLAEEKPQPTKPQEGEEVEEGYRDYRKRAKSGLDEASYYAPSESREASPPTSPRRAPYLKSASTASPSRMRASSVASTHSTLANATAQFDPNSSSPTARLTAVQSSSASSSSPSIKALPAPSPSTSPSKPPGMMGGGTGGGGGYGYGRATMMQLPGIRDESRKKVVSEDHLGGGGAVAVVETKKEEEPVQQEGDSSTTLATTDVVVLPIPSSTIEKIDESKPPASTLPPTLPPRIDAPALPPRSPTSVPPTLPPRNDTLSQQAEKNKELDDVADEAGWGIEEGVEDGEEK